MKKLISVLMLVLALNFLGLLGAVGWLLKSGHLDKDKALAIKGLVFPPPSTQPTTQPAVADSTTQPSAQLDQLLARVAGRPASEQVEFIQHTFDTQMAEVDRRQRELSDLQRQIDLAKEQLAKDHASVEVDRAALTAQQQEASRLATDAGFQACLERYIAMPSKQVKQIFMAMDDPTMVQFLTAMQPRQAAKIIKEFKSPDEASRIQKVLELMRQSQATTAVNPTAK